MADPNRKQKRFITFISQLLRKLTNVDSSGIMSSAYAFGRNENMRLCSVIVYEWFDAKIIWNPGIGGKGEWDNHKRSHDRDHDSRFSMEAKGRHLKIGTLIPLK